MKQTSAEKEIDRLIGMTWEDRATFDIIKDQCGVSEAEVITVMRANVKTSSFKMRREKVSGRKTKHRVLANEKVRRFVSPDQRHCDCAF